MEARAVLLQGRMLLCSPFSSVRCVFAEHYRDALKWLARFFFTGYSGHIVHRHSGKFE